MDPTPTKSPIKMGKRAKKSRSWIRKYDEELLILAGFICFLVGAHSIFPVATWFVGGVECLAAVAVLAWSRSR